ncbi:MAG: hypothetical protein ACC657_18665 [Thiohalomonadales bacterium]
MLELVIISIVVFEVFLIFWVNNARPDKAILKQYSALTILRVQVSFSSNWIKGIRSEDIPSFLAFRKRFQIWVLSIILMFAMFGYVIWDTGQWAQTQIKNIEEKK